MKKLALLMVLVIVFSISSLVFTYSGLLLGNLIGSKIGRYSKLIGGIILILLGVKILIEHLGIL